MKYLYKTCIVAVFAVFCFVSCDDMNDMHLGYLERGEKVYAAKVDSVSPHAGYGRIEMEVFVYTQKIDYIRFFWNARSDSADFDIGRAGVFECMIDNLSEKEYLFEIISFDKYGNKSLPFEASARVYGDIYASTLAIQRISSSYAGANGWYISMESAADNAIVTEIEYQAQDGTVKTTLIPVSTKDTVIVGAKPQTAFKYRTLYMGDGFFEAVPSNYEEGTVPDIFRNEIRPVNVVTKFGNGYAIALGTVERNTYVDIFYKNLSGNEASKRVLSGEPAVYLYDYDGSGFSQVAAYVSNPPLDTFRTEKIAYAGTVNDISAVITSSSPNILKPGDFDLGGEGVGFHDSNTGHDPGEGGANYRPSRGDYLSDAMDIEGDGGNIGYTDSGEWLIYTVEVLDEGDYEIDWYISVAGDGAACHVEIDGVASEVYSMVNNYSWDDWRYYCEENNVAPPVFHLTKGKHTIKYVFDGGDHNYNGMRVIINN